MITIMMRVIIGSLMIDLCVMNINERPWTCAKEVCRALEYKKGRARDVLKKHVSIENKQNKHELEGRSSATHHFEWPKKSQPDDYYINEKGMYELLFLSQQPKQKHLERIVAMSCFPMFNSSLQTK